MLVAYTMIGTNDVAKATSFYTPLMDLLGAEKIDAYSTEKRIWFGKNGQGLLAIGLPHDGQVATFGNGSMIAIPVATKEAVADAYSKAIELGAADEGAPGERGTGWYGAYFRDPDGNKIAIFTLLRT